MLELMATVAIVSIIVAMGAMAFTPALRRSALNRSAEELLNLITRAQVIARKRIWYVGVKVDASKQRVELWGCPAPYIPANHCAIDPSTGNPASPERLPFAVDWRGEAWAPKVEESGTANYPAGFTAVPLVFQPNGLPYGMTVRSYKVVHPDIGERRIEVTAGGEILLR